MFKHLKIPLSVKASIRTNHVFIVSSVAVVPPRNHRRPIKTAASPLAEYYTQTDTAADCYEVTTDISSDIVRELASLCDMFCSPRFSCFLNQVDHRFDMSVLYY